MATVVSFLHFQYENMIQLGYQMVASDKRLQFRFNLSLAGA
jgi:hypothetical protein